MRYVATHIACLGVGGRGGGGVMDLVWARICRLDRYRQHFPVLAHVSQEVMVPLTKLHGMLECRSIEVVGNHCSCIHKRHDATQQSALHLGGGGGAWGRAWRREGELLG